MLGSANAGGRKYNDLQRFEKLANIIKQFKLACMYVTLVCLWRSDFFFFFCSKCAKGTFSGMEVKNSNFTAIISPLTPNTFVLVVTDATMRTTIMRFSPLCSLRVAASQSTMLNMNNARTHFTNVFAQLRATENLKSSGTK